MNKRAKNYKNNPLLFVFIFLLAAATIGLIAHIILKSYHDKRTSFSSYIDNCEVKAEADEEESAKTDATSTRTYRYFGYANDAPDMYTTLKLDDSGKYAFFVNNCEGVTKYTGEYTETNHTIRLAGEITLDLEKNEDGFVLQFDLEKAGICNDSGGRFSLESYILEPPINDPNAEEQDQQKSPD